MKTPFAISTGEDGTTRSSRWTRSRKGGWVRVLAAAPLALALVAPAQEYHSNDLTPAGGSSGRLNGTSGGRQVGAAVINNPYGYPHAVVLGNNALTAVDLHPVGYHYSMAMCADDTQQGGWGYSVLGGIHALVWNGSSSSYTDLNPSGYNFSYCLGVHGGEQCGYAQNQSYFITASHAMSWHGSASSAVDLHPVPWGYAFSRATGCRDGEQVGYVSSVAYPDGDSSGYHTSSRAVRWNGSAASAVNLHPAGYDASEAVCTSGTQQGGWAYLALGTTHQHAMVWSGSAESAVDLHPTGYTDSKVTAITVDQQVGEGWVGPQGVAGSIRHALVWSGTADSVVDLNQYLPAGYANAVATGLDANGNIVGYAYNGSHPIGLAIPAGAVAVVFAPGAPPPTQLASLTLSPSNVAPGDTVQVAVALGGPAPAGGVNIDFLSTAPGLVATPASISIPEGESAAVFDVGTGGTTLTVPTSLKLYATDGSVSRAAALTLTPVVKVAGVVVNAVEGGFATRGTVSLNIPAQAGGATVSLLSGNPALVAVPATVTVPQGYTTLGFNVNTAPVTVATAVPVSATLNGTTVSGSVGLSPAPIVSLSSVTAGEVVGGFPVMVTVSLNNFVRSSGGAVIALESGDSATLQAPATVTVPYGAYGTTFTATTTQVPGRKGVSLKASYNGSSITATVFLNPVPTVTITQADYVLDTKMFKVQASTTYTNAVLTYGTSPDAPPIGTMQFEQGVFKGSIVLDTVPTQATVWNSFGGFATVPVTVKTGTGGNSTGGGGDTGGGSGGGGGGGGGITSYKLSISTSGKGTVTTNPTGSSFAAGTVVTLTATPAAGSPWVGWSGDVTGTSRTVSLTMTRDMKVTANFR